MSTSLLLEGCQPNLNQLKCSKLRSNTEYMDMYQTLNSYIDIENNDNCSESDNETKLSPFIYNTVDAQEKPFVYTLVTLLLKIKRENNDKSRLKTLQNVYQWYRANRITIDSNESKVSTFNIDGRKKCCNIDLVCPKTSLPSLKGRTVDLVQRYDVRSTTELTTQHTSRISRQTDCLSKTSTRLPNVAPKFKSGNKKTSRESPGDDIIAEDETKIDISGFAGDDDLKRIDKTVRPGMGSDIKVIPCKKYLFPSNETNVHMGRHSGRNISKIRGTSLNSIASCKGKGFSNVEELYPDHIKLCTLQNDSFIRNSTAIEGTRKYCVTAKQMTSRKQQQQQENLKSVLFKRKLLRPEGKLSDVIGTSLLAGRQHRTADGSRGGSRGQFGMYTCPDNTNYFSFTNSAVCKKNDSDEQVIPSLELSCGDLPFPAATKTKRQISSKKKLNPKHKEYKRTQSDPTMSVSIETNGENIILQPRFRNTTTDPADHSFSISRTHVRHCSFRETVESNNALNEDNKSAMKEDNITIDDACTS